MTSEQFAYWMQGFVELTAAQQPTAEQWQSITEHLKTVFVKVTPPVHFRLDKSIRPEDALRKHMNEFNQLWPGGGAPVITC